MRWNLIVFGALIIALNAMVMWFLNGRELEEPAWLLLGVVVGGFVTYASNIAQALTAPSGAPAQMTEQSALSIAKLFAKAAEDDGDDKK